MSIFENRIDNLEATQIVPANRVSAPKVLPYKVPLLFSKQVCFLSGYSSDFLAVFPAEFALRWQIYPQASTFSPKFHPAKSDPNEPISFLLQLQEQSFSLILFDRRQITRQFS